MILLVLSLANYLCLKPLFTSPREYFFSLRLLCFHSQSYNPTSDHQPPLVEHTALTATTATRMPFTFLHHGKLIHHQTRKQKE